MPLSDSAATAVDGLFRTLGVYEKSVKSARGLGMLAGGIVGGAAVTVVGAGLAGVGWLAYQGGRFAKRHIQGWWRNHYRKVQALNALDPFAKDDPWTVWCDPKLEAGSDKAKKRALDCANKLRKKGVDARLTGDGGVMVRTRKVEEHFGTLAHCGMVCSYVDPDPEDSTKRVRVGQKVNWGRVECETELEAEKLASSLREGLEAVSLTDDEGRPGVVWRCSPRESADYVDELAEINAMLAKVREDPDAYGPSEPVRTADPEPADEVAPGDVEEFLARSVAAGLVDQATADVMREVMLSDSEPTKDQLDRLARAAGAHAQATAEDIVRAEAAAHATERTLDDLAGQVPAETASKAAQAAAQTRQAAAAGDAERLREAEGGLWDANRELSEAAKATDGRTGLFRTEARDASTGTMGQQHPGEVSHAATPASHLEVPKAGADTPSLADVDHDGTLDTAEDIDGDGTPDDREQAPAPLRELDEQLAQATDDVARLSEGEERQMPRDKAARTK